MIEQQAYHIVQDIEQQKLLPNVTNTVTFIHLMIKFFSSNYYSLKLEVLDFTLPITIDFRNLQTDEIIGMTGKSGVLVRRQPKIISTIATIKVLSFPLYQSANTFAEDPLV